MCTITRADDPIDLVTRTSGRPIPGVEVRIVDPDDPTATPLPTGAEGEIRVRGAGVMQGYLDDPAASAAAIDGDGWLATGDIGVVDADANLAIRDRLHDMVIVGGFNVYPAEIERVLGEHPVVAQAAVVGRPDAALGEVPVAFVVARRPGVPDPDLDPDADPDAAADALIGFVRERLASYKVPREIWFVDTLPLTAVPKVDKVALAARARDLSDRRAG